MNSWIEVSRESDFSIYNIPFGVFSQKNSSPRLASRIGDFVIDLRELAKSGIFNDLGINNSIWDSDFLNDFISLGKSITQEVRNRIQKELSDEGSSLRSNTSFLIPVSEVKMHLPVRVGDYTDFYSSIEHATNVGKMFRDPENALLPNWKHIPVGYHGRASSIVVSGTEIKRPHGQTKPSEGSPIYGPSKRMDFELEMAFVIGKKSELGQPINISETMDHIFGMVLFNDWSARDIQKWEYVPLGPFLGKNFASSVSPWIVTMEALEPFKVAGPDQEPKVLEYLKYDRNTNYDINLSVSLSPEDGSKNVICNSNYKYMYWNMHQQLAHHTINGCNVNVGDMMASGTISGKTKDSYGSMLELSWAGKNPLQLSNGESRVFINDNDTITMKGHAEKEGIRVGFGEVVGKIVK